MQISSSCRILFVRVFLVFLLEVRGFALFSLGVVIVDRGGIVFTLILEAVDAGWEVLVWDCGVGL